MRGFLFDPLDTFSMNPVHDNVPLQGPYINYFRLHKVPANKDLSRLAFDFVRIRKSSLEHTCTLNFNNAELYGILAGLSEDREPAHR